MRGSAWAAVRRSPGPARRGGGSARRYPCCSATSWASRQPPRPPIPKMSSVASASITSCSGGASGRSAARSRSSSATPSWRSSARHSPTRTTPNVPWRGPRHRRQGGRRVRRHALGPHRHTHRRGGRRPGRASGARRGLRHGRRRQHRGAPPGGSSRRRRRRRRHDLPRHDACVRVRATRADPGERQERAPGLWRPLRARGRLGTDVSGLRIAPSSAAMPSAPCCGASSRALHATASVAIRHDRWASPVSASPGSSPISATTSTSSAISSPGGRDDACPTGRASRSGRSATARGARRRLRLGPSRERDRRRSRRCFQRGMRARWLRARLLPLIGIDAGGSFARRELRRLAPLLRVDHRGRPGRARRRRSPLGDSALLDFIAYLAEWADDVPLFLICTARPELYERTRLGRAASQRHRSINLWTAVAVAGRDSSSLPAPAQPALGPRRAAILRADRRQSRSTRRSSCAC